MGDAAQTGTLDALHGRTDEEHALRPQGSMTRPHEGGGAEPRGSVGGRGDVGLGGREEVGEIHVTHKPPCKTRDSHLFPIAACVTISSTCFRIVLVPAQGGPAPCAVTATASRGPDVHSPTSCPRTCMVRAFPVNGAAPCVTSCVCVCHRASRFRGSPMSQGEAAHMATRVGRGSLGPREQRVHGTSQSPAEAPAARLGLTRIPSCNYLDRKLGGRKGPEGACARSRARVLPCGVDGPRPAAEHTESGPGRLPEGLAAAAGTATPCAFRHQAEVET